MRKWKKIICEEIKHEKFTSPVCALFTMIHNHAACYFFFLKTKITVLEIQRVNETLDELWWVDRLAGIFSRYGMDDRQGNNRGESAPSISFGKGYWQFTTFVNYYARCECGQQSNDSRFFFAQLLSSVFRTAPQFRFFFYRTRHFQSLSCVNIARSFIKIKVQILKLPAVLLCRFSGWIIVFYLWGRERLEYPCE